MEAGDVADAAAQAAEAADQAAAAAAVAVGASAGSDAGSVAAAPETAADAAPSAPPVEDAGVPDQNAAAAAAAAAAANADAAAAASQVNPEAPTAAAAAAAAADADAAATATTASPPAVPASVMAPNADLVAAMAAAAAASSAMLGGVGGGPGAPPAPPPAPAGAPAAFGGYPGMAGMAPESLAYMQQQQQAAFLSAGGYGAPGMGGAAAAYQHGSSVSSSGAKASDNLFIAGLPPQCNEDLIKGVFGQYGTVLNVRLLATGDKPDRAALVRFGDANQAQWIIENLNQNVPMGLQSPIIVKYANKAPPPMPGQPGFQVGGQGGGGNESSPTGPPQAGTVKVWMEDRGMGFIASNSGGEDMFVHRSDLMDGQTLMRGAQITYEPHWDARKNKPVAKKIYGAVPQGTPQPPGGPGMSMPGGMVAAPPADLKDGTVKIWFEEKGFGFITDPDGTTGDFFVHRTSLQDAHALAPGTPVKFKAEWDAAKSRWMARMVYTQGFEPPNGIAAKGLPGTTGVVKSWFEEKGFGFIAGDTSAGDVFVHRSHLLDASTMAQGMTVQYDANWDQAKGKMIATRVAVGQPGGAAAAGYDYSSSYGQPAQAGYGAFPAAGAGYQAAVVAPPSATEEVVIGGLPSMATAETVSGVFGPYGQIVNLEMLPATTPGGPTGVRLKLASAAQAQWLVTNLNGNMPVGLDAPVSVAFAPAATNGAPPNRFAPY